MTDHATADLYASHYGHDAADVYAVVRREAFGEDLGQTSWITATECDRLGHWMELGAGDRLLEIGCGTGGATLRFADRHDLTAVGTDVSPAAVEAARARATGHPRGDRTSFEVVDANRPLPFGDESFDVVFCNDVINHIRDRRQLFAEWRRVLRPGGRVCFTDPVVITGPVTLEELSARAAVGFFTFLPAGVNETLLAAAGLRPVLSADTTPQIAATSEAWRSARAAHRAALCQLEGETEFERLQTFLVTVHTLAASGRLSRIALLAERSH